MSHGVGAGTYERVHSGESRLFAVWPGSWRSDLFAIDDLDTFAKQMRAQQGRDIATTGGWGGSTASGTYMRVRCKSLDS